MSSRAVISLGHQSIRGIKRTVRTLFSRKNLLYTNTAISVFMSCAGDGLQQKYQISQKEISGWNQRRSRDVGITGLVIGPFCHYWYLFLDWWLPGKTVRVVSKKLLVDQLLCSPVTILSFLSLTSYLEGKRGSEFKNELVTKGKTLYTAEWFIWPPAQIINFCFLPTKYRVLFDNSVSFGFDWYFSYVKYGKCLNEVVGDACETDDLVIDDKIHNISDHGSHLPFLHIQAAPLVQSQVGNFHWDNWSEWFYVKHRCKSILMLEMKHGKEDLINGSNESFCDIDSFVRTTSDDTDIDSDVRTTSDDDTDRDSVETDDHDNQGKITDT